MYIHWHNNDVIVYYTVFLCATCIHVHYVVMNDWHISKNFNGIHDIYCRLFMHAVPDTPPYTYFLLYIIHYVYQWEDVLLNTAIQQQGVANKP